MNEELYNSIEQSFKGGSNMAVLAKDNIISVNVKKKYAKAFIEETNKNKISDEFLKRCMRSAELFKVDKIK